MMDGRQWAGSTYGNGWMHRSLIRLLRHVDVRFVYAFAEVFVVPVCLLLNESRKTSFRYFRQRMGYGWLRAAFSVYANHCQFAKAVIDKFAMYAGKKFQLEVTGWDYFRDYADREEGFLLLSSHIGNYEMVGYAFVSERKRIHAVVYANEKASVMANRNHIFEKNNVGMIALTPDMSYLFEIDKVLSEGGIVSFPADRHMGHAKCVECTFLGEKAKFPQGPFRVATMRGLNVLAVNVMKSSAKKYAIYVEPLPYNKDLPKKEQMQQLADAYVAELEKRLHQYPFQWYNFFDFWQ